MQLIEFVKYTGCSCQETSELLSISFTWPDCVRTMQARWKHLALALHLAGKHSDVLMEHQEKTMQVHYLRDGDVEVHTSSPRGVHQLFVSSTFLESLLMVLRCGILTDKGTSSCSRRNNALSLQACSACNLLSSDACVTTKVQMNRLACSWDPSSAWGRECIEVCTIRAAWTCNANFSSIIWYINIYIICQGSGGPRLLSTGVGSTATTPRFHA